MNYQIKISCSKENLKVIRDFVNTSLAELEVNDQESDVIVLAVDEVCANVIIHSCNCDINKNLELELKKEQENIVVKIKDSGLSYNPIEHKSTSLQEIVETKRKGGLGLMLVNRIMDKIEYRVEKTFNICTLYKHVSNFSIL